MRQLRKAETKTIKEGRGGEAEGVRRVRVRSKVIIYSTCAALPYPKHQPRPSLHPPMRSTGRRFPAIFRVIPRLERRLILSSASLALSLVRVRSFMAPLLARSPSPAAEFGDESIRYRDYISPRTHLPPFMHSVHGAGCSASADGKCDVVQSIPFSSHIFYNINSEVALFLPAAKLSGLREHFTLRFRACVRASVSAYVITYLISLS